MRCSMQEREPLDVKRFDDIVTGLTEHRIRILETVYSFENHWASRQQLARALRRNRLTPYDIRALTTFVEAGVIESTTRPIASPITDIVHLYRVPDSVAALIQEWVEWRKQRGSRPVMRTRQPINLWEEMKQGV